MGAGSNNDDDSAATVFPVNSQALSLPLNIKLYHCTDGPRSWFLHFFLNLFNELSIHHRS